VARIFLAILKLRVLYFIGGEVLSIVRIWIKTDCDFYKIYYMIIYFNLWIPFYSIWLRLIDSIDMSTLMLLVQSKSTSLSHFDSMPISSSPGLYLHPLIQNLKKEFKIMKKIQNFEIFWKFLKNENTNVSKQSNFRNWDFIFCCWYGHFALFCTKKVPADPRWSSTSCILGLCVYLSGKYFQINYVWIIYLNV